jgi:hypothetical protein
MKQRSYNGFHKLLIGAVLLFSAFAANAQSGDPVTIKSVDNYAGNSNVYTDKPNTTITVTELDADKKPVRSWTGTTDGDGKITIPAGSNLSAPYLKARTADPKMAEFILPSAVLDKEPFMFSATGVVEGVVVDIKTVEGEVVATKKADKYGRVFLAAGLAAGSYLVSASNGRDTKLCNIKVAIPVYDPKTSLTRSITLDTELSAIDMTKFGRIEGEFANPGSLYLDDFISTRTVPIVRAASTTELVFDRPADLGIEPGEQTVTVGDSSTGERKSLSLVMYSAKASLTNVKVLSGTETHMVVTVLPKELEGEVEAHILSGPVSFSNGESSTTLSVTDGQADFRLQSQPGSTGKFDVSWTFSPMELVSKVWDPIKKAWEPFRKGLKTEVWDPLKKKLKEYLGTPPTGGAGAGGAKKEDPPVVKEDEKKPDPPKGGGGDTKATDDHWTRFKDKDGRTGRMEDKDDGKGYRRVVNIYDDTGSTITTTRTGDTRKTVTTTSTTKASAPRTEVEEFVDYKKDDKGEWVAEKGEKKTWEFDGKDKKLIKTEKWDKKSKGWK